MMCAMRRQYSGEVTYCWPVSCWPEATSQRRNSAFSRPSPWRVTRPATRACALIDFQFWKFGGWSGLVMRSMKAAGSIGANSPLRRRLLVMTPATSAPAWPSLGVPAAKAGIAIGSAATVPSGTVSFVCALARLGSSRLAVAPAPPIRSLRRSIGKKGSGNLVTDIAGSLFKASAAKHRLWIEGDFHLFPRVIGFVAQHVEGLSVQHGANRRLRRDLVARRRAARDDLRRRGKLAITGQVHRDHHDHILRMLDSRRDIPELLQPRDQGVEFGLRERRGGTLRRAERR